MLSKAIQNKIPQSAGVYFFKNARGKILYIGKAANLHARLRSYLRSIEVELQYWKTAALMREAKKLSWEVCKSEVEALIREAELIKKHRPSYNILMRDDKQYFYVGFSKEKFPKLFITHQPHLVAKLLSGGYVGPFTEGASLKSVLKSLRKIFPYCTCQQVHKTLCLNARIGRCFGFCCLNVSAADVFSQRVLSAERAWSPTLVGGAKRETPSPAQRAGRGKRENTSVALYQHNIRAIKQILTGKNKSLLKTLEKEMRRLSKTQRYEEAGKVRDQIRSLEKIFAHKNVIKEDMPSSRARAIHALERLLGISPINRIEAYDISNIHGKYSYGSMVVFVDGIPKKDEYRIFKIKTVKGSDDPAMIREVISRRLCHPEWPYPEVMLIDGGKGQLSAAILARFTISKDWEFADENSSLRDIRIIALAKREEELYLSPRKAPIKIKKSSESLYSLLTHLRNEAHLFAIRYYRNHHRKIWK